MQITRTIATLVIMAGIMHFGSTSRTQDLKHLVGSTTVRNSSERGGQLGTFQLSQEMSNRCVTPYSWCSLPQSVPVNTPCWCATPNGPVGGFVK